MKFSTNPVGGAMANMKVFILSLLEVEINVLTLKVGSK